MRPRDVVIGKSYWCGICRKWDFHMLSRREADRRAIDDQVA